MDLTLEYNDDLGAFTFMQETSVDLGLGYNEISLGTSTFMISKVIQNWSKE